MRSVFWESASQESMEPECQQMRIRVRLCQPILIHSNPEAPESLSFVGGHNSSPSVFVSDGSGCGRCRTSAANLIPLDYRFLTPRTTTTTSPDRFFRFTFFPFRASFAATFADLTSSLTGRAPDSNPLRAMSCL